MSIPTPNEINKLFFVFNANGGTMNAVIDSAKKLLMINGCSLCTITHGILGEREGWKDCKEEIGIPIEYVHRDEVTEDLAAVIVGKYPCVLAVTSDRMVMLLPPEVLDRCKGNIADLKGRLKTNATFLGLRFPKEFLVTPVPR